MTTLSVGDALADGLERLRNPDLFVLVATAYLLQLAVAVGTQSQLAIQREQLGAEPVPFGPELVPEVLPLALGVSLAVATLVWMVSMVALITVSMVALRVLCADGGSVDAAAGDASGARSTVDGGLGGHADGLGRLTLRGVGACLVGAVTVSAGLVLFVLPGLFVATVFAFTLPIIATSGVGVLEGMKRSYELTRGARFRVFGVLLTIGAGFFAFSIAGGFATVLLESRPLGAELVNVAFATLAWLFVLAVLASAFDGLEGIRAEEAEKWEGIDDELLP